MADTNNMDSKICTKCHQSKLATKFAYRNKEKGTLQSWCRDCLKAHNKIVWQTNPDRKERVSKVRARIKLSQRTILYDIVEKHLRVNPCIDCHEADIIVLEFDHVRGEKIAAISTMLSNLVSEDILKAEIAKCEIRCANCHRRVTAYRGQWRTSSVIGEADSLYE